MELNRLFGLFPMVFDVPTRLPEILAKSKALNRPGHHLCGCIFFWKEMRRMQCVITRRAKEEW